MQTSSGNLSLEDLMTKGYFPDRVIPPVNSLGMLNALPDVFTYIEPIMQAILEKKPNKFRSRCVTHSVPKRKHLRRSLSIPNPMHQCMAANEVANHWKTLHAFLRQIAVGAKYPSSRGK
jgi:hypothetical protein